MEPLDFWRLNEELTIDQATYLMMGMVPYEPKHLEAAGVLLTEQSQVDFSMQFDAISSALKSALLSKQIEGRIVPFRSNGEIGPALKAEGVSLDSVINLASLKAWCAAKGIRPAFLFSTSEEIADYLDPSHPRFAPKLAAAVRAWQAVGDVKSSSSPKKSLEKWVRENAASLRLTDEDGIVSQNAVEEISKVANWQPQGGAPKTPSN